MLAFLHRILDWFKNVFWKEEMELALVGLQNSGKTTFVNVISVRQRRYPGSKSGRSKTRQGQTTSHCGRPVIWPGVWCKRRLRPSGW